MPSQTSVVSERTVPVPSVDLEAPSTQVWHRDPCLMCAIRNGDRDELIDRAAAESIIKTRSPELLALHSAYTPGVGAGDGGGLGPGEGPDQWTARVQIRSAYVAGFRKK